MHIVTASYRCQIRFPAPISCGGHFGDNWTNRVNAPADAICHLVGYVGGLLVVAADVVQAANDKQQLEPMVEHLNALPEELGKIETLLADNGYFSAANVTTCATANIEPLIAIGREPHHRSLTGRFAAAPAAPQDPTPVQAMAHRLKTPQGKELYALRKQVPEPVFGIIKSVLGFRQFLLRGLDRVRGEWSLVTMAWNMKRMFALCPSA
jgi:hypothetical protein